jgi:hypothetical protein
VPFGQAKLGDFGSAVFFPNAGVKEESGDVVDAVTRTLTKVVGKAEVGDQLAGMSPPGHRVLGEATGDGDVDAHLHFLHWFGAVRAALVLEGSWDPVARRCKEAEEESSRRRSQQPRSRSLFWSPCGRSGAA